MRLFGLVESVRESRDSGIVRYIRNKLEPRLPSPF